MLAAKLVGICLPSGSPMAGHSSEDCVYVARLSRFGRHMRLRICQAILALQPLAFASPAL
jgi:hypothetical protein